MVSASSEVHSLSGTELRRGKWAKVAREDFMEKVGLELEFRECRKITQAV